MTDLTHFNCDNDYDDYTHEKMIKSDYDDVKDDYGDNKDDYGDVKDDKDDYDDKDDPGD